MDRRPGWWWTFQAELFFSGNVSLCSKDLEWADLMDLIGWGAPTSSRWISLIYHQDGRREPRLQNTFSGIPRVAFDSISGYYCLVNSTHKTNCHDHTIEILLVGLSFVVGRTKTPYSGMKMKPRDDVSPGGSVCFKFSVESRAPRIIPGHARPPVDTCWRNTCPPTWLSQRGRSWN